MKKLEKLQPGVDNVEMSDRWDEGQVPEQSLSIRHSYRTCLDKS
jgi:hypothetical protein